MRDIHSKKSAQDDLELSDVSEGLEDVEQEQEYEVEAIRDKKMDKVCPIPMEIILDILLQHCSRRSQIVCYNDAKEPPIQSRVRL
jgi:hypothetical protein